MRVKSRLIVSVILLAGSSAVSSCEMGHESAAASPELYKNKGAQSQSDQAGQAASPDVDSQGVFTSPQIQAQQEDLPRTQTATRQQAGTAARSETTVNPDWATSTYPRDPNTPDVGRIHNTPGLPNTDTPTSGNEFGTTGRPIPVAPSKR